VKSYFHSLQIKFLLVYLFGIFVLGAGVILFSRASIGAAPWDTAILNFETLAIAHNFPITKGMSSLFHTSLLLVVVMFMQRKAKHLLAVIPMVLISLSIDLWDNVFLVSLLTENHDIFTRIVWFFAATLLMTFGLASIIISGFPPNVYDDFHLTVLQVFKVKSFALGRWVVEFSGLTLGLVYAWIENDGFGSVSWLSLFLAITFGFFIQFFVNIFKRLHFINRVL
jgi:uncharacterized membrane protein YczE